MNSRREWLQQVAACGALAALSPARFLNAQAPANARRLDLHHHFGSPRWIKRAVEAKRQGWLGGSRRQTAVTAVASMPMAVFIFRQRMVSAVTAANVNGERKVWIEGITLLASAPKGRGK